MNLKVKTETNKAKLGACLRISLESTGSISICPWPASPGPIYRLSSLEEQVGFNINYNTYYNMISYFDYDYTWA
jgi:hypothetical protein